MRHKLPRNVRAICSWRGLSKYWSGVRSCVRTDLGRHPEKKANVVQTGDLACEQRNANAVRCLYRLPGIALLLRRDIGRHAGNLAQCTGVARWLTAMMWTTATAPDATSSMCWGASLASTTNSSARGRRNIASRGVIFENECSGAARRPGKFGATIYLLITAALSFKDAYDNPTRRHEAAASTKKSLIRA